MGSHYVLVSSAHKDTLRDMTCTVLKVMLNPQKINHMTVSVTIGKLFTIHFGIRKIDFCLILLYGPWGIGEMGLHIIICFS